MSSPLPELVDHIVKVDDLVLDGSKVGWYPERIAAWERGEKIAPITMDVAWTRKCNYACDFCYAQMQASNGKTITREIALQFLSDAAEVGVKGVSLISDGESSLVPFYAESIEHGHKVGLQIGIGTNGRVLRKPMLEQILPHLSYLRFNFSGGTREGYARIMGVKPEWYDEVIQNVKDAMEIKRRDRLGVTVNMQLVCDPKNEAELLPFAELAKSIRPDYAIIKHCFPAGHLIKMADGSWRPIEDVRVGDTVLSHTAKGRMVTKTFRHEVAEDLIELNLYGNEPIRVTADHPMLAVRIGPPMSRERMNSRRNLDRLNPEWTRAGDLTPAHAVLYAVDDATAVVDAMPLTEPLKRGRARGQTELPVSAPLMRLLGYHMAEGWVRKGRRGRVTGTALKFHEAETALIEDAKSCALAFGINATVTQFGTNARNKALPDWVMHLPTDLQKEFLIGYFRGDGTILTAPRAMAAKGKRRYGQISVATASRVLAYQVRELLLRLGIVAGIRGMRQPMVSIAGGPLIGGGNLWKVYVYGRSASELLSILEPRLYVDWEAGSGTRNMRTWIHNGNAWFPVRSVRPVPHSGAVYNFAVEVDESYVTTAGTCHNCADDVDGTLGVDYSKYAKLNETFDRIEAMGDEGFRIVVKRDRLKDEGRRDYSRCYGPPFILQMSGNGLIAPCGFLFNERYRAFHIGNICDERFKDMYQSDRYWEVLRYLASEEFDPRSRCGPNCLQTQTNSFLFHYKEGRVQLPAGNPPPHLGFL